MRLRDRDLKRLLAAPLQRRHWRGAFRGLTVYSQPAEAFRRYVTNTGEYPWSPVLKTPLGPVRPTLTSYHDLLTVHEIFCRQDYGRAQDASVVVDIGANVGLATLFFLTRRADAHVYCFEPDPANIARLRGTLAGLEGRYELDERAVTPDQREQVSFVPRGRYGHIAGDDHPDAVLLAAVGILEALGNILSHEPEIDLIKIDTEGSESTLLAAIQDSPFQERVRTIVYEDRRGRTRWHLRDPSPDRLSGPR